MAAGIITAAKQEVMKITSLHREHLPMDWRVEWARDFNLVGSGVKGMSTVSYLNLVILIYSMYTVSMKLQI